MSKIIEKNKALRAFRYGVRKIQEMRVEHLWRHNKNEYLSSNKSRFKALKAIHQDRPCFVIGNGPSLNKMDLNLMSGHISIASNAFFLKYPELSFRPTYYTVEDNLPAEDNADELNRLTGSQLIIPIDLRNTLCHRDAIYINFKRSYMHSSNKSFPMFSFDALERIYWGGTVAYMNIQLAHHFGCNPIYLIGIDLSYEIPKDIHKQGIVLTSMSSDPNHFHPDYFGRDKRWHLPCVERMEQSFKKAHIELAKKNIKVYNATIGGKLDSIPRVDYNSVFSSSCHV